MHFRFESISLFVIEIVKSNFKKTLSTMANKLTRFRKTIKWVYVPHGPIIIYLVLGTSIAEVQITKKYSNDFIGCFKIRMLACAINDNNVTSIFANKISTVNISSQTRLKRLITALLAI